MSTLYRKILPYQTRLLHLPKHSSAEPEDPIICSLVVADILHPLFDGFGVRSGNGEEDRLVSFNALSYVWGSLDKRKSIICNGLHVSITENLHEALVAMRRHNVEAEYLWIDALCINQDDGKEKANQVLRMFQIFQQAKHTIAWLGDPKELLDDTIAAVSLTLDRDVEVTSFAVGAQWIYSRPWFRRLWIQQEVFASRSLVLFCGSYSFKSSAILSPASLLEFFTSHSPDSKVSTGKSLWRETKIKAPHNSHDESFHFGSLVDQADKDLQSFNHFAKREPTDIIECLLRMSNTSSTDPRDFVYGVLGIAKFPSKAISIEDWFEAKDRESFIPIDYDASMEAIWCTLTRVLLFKVGFGLLAKFKVSRKDETNAKESKLPSWSIDWRLTGQNFYQNPNVKGDGYSIGQRQGSMLPTAFFEIHDENLNFRQNDPTRLVVRGRSVKPPYVLIDKGGLRIQLSKNRVSKLWHIPDGVRQDDIVMQLDVSEAEEVKQKLWLLRPNSDEEFILIACLAGRSYEDTPPYSSWIPRPEIQQTSSRVALLMKTHEYDYYEELFGVKPKEDFLEDCRTFVIV